MKTDLIGRKCVATPEAPFTEEQRCRLGTVLEIGELTLYVEWVDSQGWRTRSWVPRTWLNIDSE